MNQQGYDAHNDDLEEPDEATMIGLGRSTAVPWPDRWHAYRDMVRATWGSTPGHAMADPTQRGPHLGLALAGEAGEVVEMFKKAHRGNDACAGMNVERLLDELGDVLWAIVSIADWAGHSLDDVRILNQVKMRERHPHLVEDPR